MPKNSVLLAIAPQRDFCDPMGTLYVEGADQDMTRLASFVRAHSSSLGNIVVTMDSHRDIHIAHPAFWRNARGNQPPPFTYLSHDDVERGLWRIAVPSALLRGRVANYIRSLELNRRYKLMIWPPHCIVGGSGHNIAPILHEAIRHWERTEFATATVVTVGQNPFTEHYSAIQAAVPDPNDPTTYPNIDLLKLLREADVVLVAGEPGSHMVAETLRDIAEATPRAADLSRFVLLTDAMSPAAGFGEVQRKLIADMTGRGMRSATTTDIKL